MFKKRTVQKKVDLSKDLESIQINANRADREKGHLDKAKKISKAEGDEHAFDDDKEQSRRIMRYGLIEKQAEAEQRPHEQNTLLNLYIKMRMQQIYAKKEQQVVDTTASEILQMQKQYLSAAESKITEYDVKEIQKKLQKLATEMIKSEVEKRNLYMVDLLQNEHERMQYASKKELKVLKQQRERLEKELSSKYATEGRRHYLEYLKQENFRDIN